MIKIFNILRRKFTKINFLYILSLFNKNISRLKTILHILDKAVMNSNNSDIKSDNVSYFHSLCFSILSIFYSIPSQFNNELQDILLSSPKLIEFVKNMNDKYKIWKNEKSFLMGIRNAYHNR
ncbi:hypothetical protein PFMG_00914 [Plasmodium falciparum IGH-CR14]|uniref:Uncharacterized protein n=1 Tax=Plasmodium falciparum IGH-CR14 TaxID=580059 RepID=A0A0L1I6G7_PLAFA|nr:hypothetical protein PFMG_00914 [Plasmodium falciparum IGH-CR14]